MVNPWQLLDLAMIFTVLASASAGFSAGMPFRIFIFGKRYTLRFNVSLFFVSLSVFVGAAVAAFIFLVKAQELFSSLYVYAAFFFALGLVSSILPRSFGLPALVLAVLILFLSFVRIDSLRALEPGQTVATLAVQQLEGSTATIAYADDTRTAVLKVDETKVGIEVETLRIAGPLGAILGRDHFRPLALVSGSRRQASLSPKPTVSSIAFLDPMFRAIGLRFSSSLSPSVQLGYLKEYALRFDAAFSPYLEAL